VLGSDIGWRSAGRGPAVVLLHGFTHDSRVWLPQLSALADAGYRAIAWDAPGAGATADPPETFTLTDWASCLAGFLDALNVGHAILVGVSWGGLLAQEFYRSTPTRVLSLVLADTYSGWTGSLSREVAEQRLEAAIADSYLAPPEFVARYLPGMFSNAVDPAVRSGLGEVMSEFHPAGFRRMATVLALADTSSFLPSIAVPTLLIWGEDDVRSPITVGQEFERAIPGSRLVVIEHAGHISNLEQPELFSAALITFLRAQPTN